MSFNLKKIYYVLLIVLVLFGATYYAYTHQALDSHMSEDSMGNEGGYKIIYETEVDSEDECTSFEKYNSEDKTCYYECDDEKDCDAIEEKINNELLSWADEESINEANKNKTSENEKGITAENIYAEFLILPGEKIRFGNTLKESQGRTDYYSTIWDKIAALSPDDLSNKYIEQFDVYKNEKDDTIAFVDDEDGNGKWRIAINEPIYSRQSRREQYMTIIHELAHIISLNKDQTEFTYTDESNSSRKCLTLSLEEGCLREDSYLYKFYTTFKNDIWGKNDTEMEKILSSDAEAKDFNNNFVTEYAATNEVEDFAESFTYFVIKDDTHYAVPIAMEKSMSEKDKKIAFMYHDLLPNDGFRIIREQMRAALSRDLLKGL